MVPSATGPGYAWAARRPVMTRHFSPLSLIGALALSTFACDGGIPRHIEGWRVEVGPPGNEFYQEPASGEEPPPPSDALLQVVERVAPAHTRVKRWELQAEGRYFIRAEAGPEEYDFVFSSDGTLLQLDYENELTNVSEAPGELILPGSRQGIPLAEVPQPALQTIATISPGMSPTEAWHVETPAGSRDVVAAGGLAFFARPDGQIQAAGLIERGALNEAVPPDPVLKSREELLAEAEGLFGQHRERFDFERQIRELGQGSGPGGAGFRFVVLGDSRSNPELWRSIVEHIQLLDPQPRFVINTGDIVRHGYAREYAEYFIPPLLDIDRPFFVAIGNHDDGDNGKAVEYQYLFGSNSLDYFFDYGGRRFVFVDNVTLVRSPEETLAWLEEVLESTPSGRRIVVSAHKPIATVKKWAYHAWHEEASERFAELMSEHGVDHVFFGHIHAYSTASLAGVDYTIAGGGGAGLHDRYGPQGNVHHYVVCDVRADGSLEQQVVRFFKVE